MEELTIEEKAKRYDEALIRGSRLWECGEITKENYEYIFSELKESEDERIRKEIIAFLTYYHTGQGNSVKYDDNWIAWLKKQGECHISHDDKIMIEQLIEYFTTGHGLQNTNETVVEFLKDVKKKLEKQGEQKPADKVEPKFKVGDWVVWDNKISCHIDNICQGKESLMYIITDTNNMTRSYSVKGFDNNAHLWTIQDAKDGDVLAYNDGSLTIFHYRLSGLDAGLYMSYVLLTDKIEFKQTCAISNVHPATKEQHDTLVKAMADAGYTFDFEKKELKKIEPAEWSEEDRDLIEEIISHYRHLIAIGSLDSERYKSYIIPKLKSFKERYTWKPSDEQMGVLDEVIRNPHLSTTEYSGLIGLMEQLKKLKG